MDGINNKSHPAQTDYIRKGESCLLLKGLQNNTASANRKKKFLRVIEEFSSAPHQEVVEANANTTHLIL